MVEYIKKEDAIAHPFANGHYDKANANRDFIRGHESYKEWLEDIPAADVRENVKGEWLHVVEEIEGTTFRGCRCSKCNYWKGMGIFNFCPNCGAEMREGRNES